MARLREPFGAPATKDFAAGLEPSNALAGRSPGFVWRLRDELGDASNFRPFDGDVMVIVN